MNIYANQSDPIVLPDDQYPKWIKTELEMIEKRLIKRHAGSDERECALANTNSIRAELKRARKERIKANNAAMAMK